MPFTPIHFGVDALAKVIAPRKYSFQSFVVSQVLIDIEPGIGLLTGSAVLHGPTHTYPGAVVIAGATVGVFALWQRFASKRRFTLGHGIPLPTVAISALIGTLSHVTIDGMMHADMAGRFGLPPSEVAGAGPEMLCLGAAILASAIAVVRHAYQTFRAYRHVK